MAMAMQMMKRSMSRMLKQSIVDLCRTSLGTDGYMEIDGIVCITIGEEETEEIVVKVHEILGDEDDIPINIRKPAPPPPRNAPPANMRGPRMHPQQPPHSSQGQSMGNTQQGNKPIYSQSPLKPNQGPHGMMHGQGRGHPQGPQRQMSGPPKQQHQQQMDNKKMHPMQDDSIIKIEIESDEEPVDTEPVKGGKAPVVCNVCDMGLASVAALKIHMTDIHRALVCEVCWSPFATKPELDNHMKTHKQAANRPSPSPKNDNTKADKKDGERYKCGVCGNTSDSHKVMVEHLKLSHEFQGCYTCMLCREHFPNKPTFSIHRKLSHPAAKDVICKTCGVGLKQMEFENHKRECAQANEATPQKKNKKGKDEEDSGPPPKRQCSTPSAPANKPSKQHGGSIHGKGFECQICCLYLDSFKSYGIHVKNVHQRHVCPICVGTFQTQRAVNQHTARHTGALPFSCEKCGLGSHSEDELKRHNIVSHNVQPALFTCAQCNILIGSKGDFLNHMAEVHKSDYLWDEELEKYVVLEMEGEEEEGYDEEGEYMDEEGYMENHSEYGNSRGQNYRDGNYDMEGEEDYGDEGMDPDNENIVTCNICELVMPNVQALKEHINGVHHAVVCETCWRPFLSQSELETHRKTQHEGGGSSGSKQGGPGTPGSNSGSSKEATTSKQPSKQPANASPASSASAPSPSASRQTPTSTTGGSHPKVVTNFKCGVCGAATEGRRGMVDHLKVSHEYLGCFTCMLCGEFFPNKPTFTIHRKLSHSEAKEMTCNSCGVGLYSHEYDDHIAECEGSGIDIKEAEWEGKKETPIKKEKREKKEKKEKK